MKKYMILLFALVLLALPVTTFAQPNPTLVYGQTVTGILQNGQVNVWQFYGNVGDQVELSLVSQVFDTYLTVTSPNGTIAAADDDSGAGLNSYIDRVQLPWTGAYTVTVSSTTNVGGAYSLSVGRIDPPTGPFDIYSNNFETEIGYPEWNFAPADRTPTGRRFLGPFLNETVVLNLSNLPQHTNVSLSFDLFVIKSWDGVESANNVGPDVFDVRLTGSDTPLLNTTFSNVTYSAQSYPNQFGGDLNPPGSGAVEINSLGYGEFGDAVYNLGFEFPHGESWLSLSFTGQNLEFLANEAWGIDNIRVSVRSVEQYGYLQFCSGGYPNLIRSGMRALNPVVTPLRAWPAEAAITYEPLRAFTRLTVLDGPTCAEGQTWWQVTIGDSNLIGWIREFAPGGQLLLQRELGTEVNPIQWAELSDYYAQIESVATSLNVRDAPSVNTGVRVTSISRGLPYYVVGRTQNGIWYQIQYVLRGVTSTGWVCGHPLTRRNFNNDAVNVVQVFAEQVTNHAAYTAIPNEDCAGNTYP